MWIDSKIALVEGDVIWVRGKYIGLKSYKTVIGLEKVVPEIDAVSIFNSDFTRQLY